MNEEDVSKTEADEAEKIVRGLEYNQPESSGRWVGSKTKKLFAMIGERIEPDKSMEGSGSDYSSFKSKLEEVESGGDYTAYNEGSGAYGKYQFIPSTLKEYAKKTGQTIEQAKTPEGQDKMFERFTEDNKNRLKKIGIEPTELNLWIAHNQGVGGAAAILKAGKLTPRLKKNIASNLPSGVEPTIENYINHWSTKFSG